MLSVRNSEDMAHTSIQYMVHGTLNKTTEFYIFLTCLHPEKYDLAEQFFISLEGKNF